ncbi:MAG: hypothetical protein AB7I30_06155 [Isosphaeraceae bacterium]
MFSSVFFQGEGRGGLGLGTGPWGLAAPLGWRWSSHSMISGKTSRGA